MHDAFVDGQKENNNNQLHESNRVVNLKLPHVVHGLKKQMGNIFLLATLTAPGLVAQPAAAISDQKYLRAQEVVELAHDATSKIDYLKDYDPIGDSRESAIMHIIPFRKANDMSLEEKGGKIKMFVAIPNGNVTQKILQMVNSTSPSIKLEVAINIDQHPIDMERIQRHAKSTASFSQEDALETSAGLMRLSDTNVGVQMGASLSEFNRVMGIAQVGWGQIQTSDKNPFHTKVMSSHYLAHGSATGLMNLVQRDEHLGGSRAALNEHFTTSTLSTDSFQRSMNYDSSVAHLELSLDEIALILEKEEIIFQNMSKDNKAIKLDGGIMSTYTEGQGQLLSALQNKYVNAGHTPREYAAVLQFAREYLKYTKQFDEFVQEFSILDPAVLSSLRASRDTASDILKNTIRFIENDPEKQQYMSNYYAPIYKGALVALGRSSEGVKPKRPEVQDGGIEQVANMIKGYIDQNNTAKAYATAQFVLERLPEKKEELQKHLVYYYKSRLPAWLEARDKVRIELCQQILVDIFSYRETVIDLGHVVDKMYRDDIESGAGKLVQFTYGEQNRLLHHTYYITNDYTGEGKNIYAKTRPEVPVGWTLQRALGGSYIIHSEYITVTYLTVKNPLFYPIDVVSINLKGGKAFSAGYHMSESYQNNRINIEKIPPGGARESRGVLEHSTPIRDHPEKLTLAPEVPNGIASVVVVYGVDTFENSKNRPEVRLGSADMHKVLELLHGKDFK